MLGETAMVQDFIQRDRNDNRVVVTPLRWFKSRGTQAESKLANPPSGPVPWIASGPGEDGVVQCEIIAPRWFEARERACAVLGCPRESISVVLKPEPAP